MMRRTANYTCPHGLLPGPYSDWGPEHQAEHRWLLDVCATAVKADVVMLPTEAFARSGNGFTPERLSWLATEVGARGMLPCLWLDKWLWVRDLEFIRAWLTALHQVLAPLNPVWNLSSELDLLWLLHPTVQARDVLLNLMLGREHLMALGVPPQQIWAGGATVEGTLILDKLLYPGVLTWTAWRAIQRGLPGGSRGVYTAVLEDLGAIRSGMLRSGEVAMVEAGWSVANGGEMYQAAVLEDALQAARDLGVHPGLWTLVDWPHDQRDPIEAGYGVLDAAGNARPALEAWRSVTAAPATTTTLPER